MFVGTSSGQILTYVFKDSVWTRVDGPWEEILIGRETVVSCADVDGDNDKDCVVGEENGNINYFENVGSVLNPIFVQKHGELKNENFFHNIDVGDNAYPAFIDANVDGLHDLLIGSRNGKISLFLNVGTKHSPHYSKFDTLVDPFDTNQKFLGFYTKPTVFDINDDGLPDFIVAAETHDSGRVYIDAVQYTVFGAASVISLITFAGIVFFCRNNKKTAPLVTAKYEDPENQALKTTNKLIKTTEPVIGSIKSKGRLKSGFFKRKRNKF